MVFSRASRLEEALVRLSWASESRWISLSSCKSQTAELKEGESSQGMCGIEAPPQAQADLLSVKDGERGEDKN